MRTKAIASCLLICFTITFNGKAAAETDQVQVGPFEHHNVPGGIAIVPTGVTRSEPRPTAQWNQRAVAVLPDKKEWFAIVGIPLSANADSDFITVTADERQYRIAFNIIPVRYDEQRLTIKNKRKVNPAPLDMKRIKSETARLKKVKSMRRDAPIASHFIWPVEGPISSTFGLKRFYNGEPRKPHGGIDIAMPTGTPIFAPADGKVIDTGDYFFNGNSVFIEHGQGVQTFYAHMDSIAVDIGTTVQQGDMIGTVGATGRVTGAHLHWSLGLNGTWVDPTLALAHD